MILVPASTGYAAAATPTTAPNFELDVMPILTVAGCNMGACHGKSRGQNGFALSLLGFDRDFDYGAIVKEARGRRVFPAAPEESLLLRKATAQAPHGGGERFAVGSPHYETLRTWIAAGAPRKRAEDPELKRIVVSPAERPLKPNTTQQLTVTAHYTDGTTREVTSLCAFQSSETPVAAINAAGLIQAGKLPGEATIMARFMGQIATWNVVIPYSGNVPADVYAKLPRRNFIDDLVWAKLKQLGVTPSELCSDSTFLRRAHLDIIGRLPTPAEVRAFLADTSPDKRQRLIDALLERPEYADFWANKWADLLRPNPYRVGLKTTMSYDMWIRDAFRQNLPYDEFARQLVTARGSTWQNGAAVMFRDRRTPDEITTLVSQLFLGVRLECAKCHQHPFEVYSQTDFYSLAAYFSRIGYKGTGISAPISGSEEFIFTAVSGQVKHPLTGEPLTPKPLFGEAPTIGDEEDPRDAFARWMTATDNKTFAQAGANRIWAELMGRGLVDPVDDLRATNPPSNAPLLAALGEEFRRVKFDTKQLLRTIMTSHVYGLSSLPGEGNSGDTRNFSRHYRQRLRAETLLDAMSDITGVEESFASMPPGSRAVELWNHRLESQFLDAFGRPDPNQDPPCERTSDTTLVQSLHLMNAPGLHRKITSDTGRAAKLAAGSLSPREIVEELYLLSYARFPRPEELAAAVALFPADGKSQRRQTTEDLLWALVNTPEFIFKD